MGIEFGRRVLAFFRSTLIGGLFVLAPIVILLVVIGQVVDVVYTAIRPAFDWLPDKSIGGVSIIMLLVFGAVIAICFLAGLGAKIAFAKRFVRWIESLLLSNLPGYSLMKGVGENIIGVTGQAERQAVLAHFAHSSMVGFVMDRLPNGQLIVFVPGAPNAYTGTLHIMEPNRIEPLDVPIRSVVDFLNRLGVEPTAEMRNRLAKQGSASPIITQ